MPSGEDSLEKHHPNVYKQDGHLLPNLFNMPITKSGLTDKEVCKIHLRLFSALWLLDFGIFIVYSVLFLSCRTKIRKEVNLTLPYEACMCMCVCILKEGVIFGWYYVFLVLSLLLFILSCLLHIFEYGVGFLFKIMSQISRVLYNYAQEKMFLSSFTTISLALPTTLKHSNSFIASISMYNF